MDNTEFLTVTDKKCAKTHIKGIVSNIMRKYSFDLGKRQGRLRELLEFEENQLDSELREKRLASINLEQKEKWQEMENIRTRRRLDEEEFLKTKMNQMKMENDERQRIQESQNILKETKSIQFAQIQEKQKKKQKAKEEDNWWSDLNYHQKIEKDEYERQQNDLKVQIQHQNRKYWTQQMEEIHQRTNNEKEKWKVEEERLNHEITLAEKNLEKLSIEREKCKKLHLKEMLGEQMEDIQKRKMRDLLEKRMEDKEFNQSVVDQLNYEKTCQRMEKDSIKRSTDAYIEYLRSLKKDQLAAKELQQQDERNRERPEILAKIQHNQKIWQRNMHR
ncbi:hypothetical protein ACFFRR_007507 [Megaselia abdita]